MIERKKRMLGLRTGESKRKKRKKKLRKEGNQLAMCRKTGNQLGRTLVDHQILIREIDLRMLIEKVMIRDTEM